MCYIVQTPDGRLFVRKAYIERLQWEIDSVLEEDPSLHPIDAVTLVTLEANGYTWDFVNGHVLPADEKLN